MMLAGAGGEERGSFTHILTTVKKMKDTDGNESYMRMGEKTPLSPALPGKEAKGMIPPVGDRD